MDDYLSGEQSGLNKKIGAFTLLALMFLAIALTPVAMVSGQTSELGVQILQVAPAGQLITNGQSTLNGTVGQAFTVQGTIYTSNGSYQLTFGTTVVASGTSQGFYVNVNFIVPALPSGSYDLTLRDLTINVNSTGASPVQFLILTGYLINAVPTQVQEGSSVLLNVSVTGASPATNYYANVTVAYPSSLNTEFNKLVTLGSANQNGVANAQFNFPDSSFQPGDSSTNFTGSYSVYFNESDSLANTQFSVGFLDSTTYHRGQTATINAVGYTPNEAATLNITTSSGAPFASESLMASVNGTISATWPVPSNAAVGTYTATITPQGAQKAVQDSETFTIPGYSVQVKTVNIAGEVVPQIEVQAQDASASTTVDSTSDSNGIAPFSLEAGAYNLTAFWNGVNVGESNIAVTGVGTFTLQCQLSDLKVLVQNQNGVAMPYVNLTVTYSFQPTNGGASQTGNISGETGLSGTCILNSTLPGINYNIIASIYNQPFNAVNNNTVSNLPAQAVVDILIICPNEALTINVVGHNEAAISGADIKLAELTNGLFFTATTDDSGSVTSQVTFGIYRLQIYKDNILINQTTVKVFNVTQQQIFCSLYGIRVSVSVVDFFGSPIPNANVTLNGPSAERFSAKTLDDGTATFDNVVGGDMQIVAFAQGAPNTYQAVTLIVDNPTSVQIKMDRYITLGSVMIPVSLLIALIIILVAIVLFVTVEIYRRRKVKSTAEG